MVLEEIYVLQKHANFSAEFIKKIPVYERRFYLHKLKEELDERKKQIDKQNSKSNQTISKGKRR